MVEEAPKVGDIIKPSETITAGQEATLGALNTLKGAATLITTVGTVLDISNNVKNNKEAREMQKEQEQNIIDKEKRIKKAKRKRYRKYNSPLSTNKVVMDMFDQATGHTRYGASQLPGV